MQNKLDVQKEKINILQKFINQEKIRLELPLYQK